MTKKEIENNKNLKCAETSKNEVFGAEGADNFWDLEIINYTPLVYYNLETRGVFLLIIELIIVLNTATHPSKEFQRLMSEL